MSTLRSKTMIVAVTALSLILPLTACSNDKKKVNKTKPNVPTCSLLTAEQVATGVGVPRVFLEDKWDMNCFYFTAPADYYSAPDRYDDYHTVLDVGAFLRTGPPRKALDANLQGSDATRIEDVSGVGDAAAIVESPSEGTFVAFAVKNGKKNVMVIHVGWGHPVGKVPKLTRDQLIALAKQAAAGAAGIVCGEDRCEPPRGDPST